MLLVEEEQVLVMEVVDLEAREAEDLLTIIHKLIAVEDIMEQ